MIFIKTSKIKKAIMYINMLFAIFLAFCILVYAIKEKDYYSLIGLVIPTLIIFVALRSKEKN